MDIEYCVKKLVVSHVDIKLDIEKLSSDDLLDYLGVNSINIIRIIVALEDIFDIEFDVDMLALEFYNSLGDFIQYVKELVDSSD